MSQTQSPTSELVAGAATGESREWGSVKRMRTRIGLLAQPESMRSIIGATQQSGGSIELEIVS